MLTHAVGVGEWGFSALVEVDGKRVGRGIFLERLIPPGVRGSGKMTMAEVKKGYEALGGKFIEYVEPKQLFTGVWLTGPVPRPFPEKNYQAMIHYRDPEGKPRATLRSRPFAVPRGGSLMVQHYIEEIGQPDHLRLVSTSDVFFQATSSMASAGFVNGRNSPTCRAAAPTTFRLRFGYNPGESVGHSSCGVRAKMK